MTDLIIHVGPAKCGSTSIQAFFQSQKEPCIQKIRFNIIDELEISKLNLAEPEASATDYIHELLSANTTQCDVLIFSNEFLFQCPSAIKNICRIAENFVSGICIVGYCRRQSDFLISAYSQWLFRLPDRIEDSIDVLNKFKVDPILFSGLERQLMEYVIDDFNSAKKIFNYDIFNWYNSYQNISELVNSSVTKIACGVLPKKGAGLSLIRDFCEKANLSLNERTEKNSEKIANIRFNDDFIEAVNAALTFGMEMPGPHDCNGEIEYISEKMNTKRNTDSDFLSKLKAYIDTFFSESNHNLCKVYQLDNEYFHTPEQLDKLQILDVIKREAEERSSNPSAVIDRYRMLSAEMARACFALAKKETR